jgi:hypothetical protein
MLKHESDEVSDDAIGLSLSTRYHTGDKNIGIRIPFDVYSAMTTGNTATNLCPAATAALSFLLSNLQVVVLQFWVSSNRITHASAGSAYHLNEYLHSPPHAEQLQR